LALCAEGAAFLRSRGLTPLPPPPAHVAEARAVLPAIEAACQAADLGRVRQWLDSLAVNVANPPGKEARALQAATLAQTCAHLPGAVFSAETLREAMVARDPEDRGKPLFEFWPATPRLVLFLEHLARPILAQRDALRAIATPPQARPEAECQPPTQAEIEAVAAKVRMFKAEVLGGAAKIWPDAPSRPQPIYASPEQLTEARRRLAEAAA
jgi:hypothetical protein